MQTLISVIITTYKRPFNILSRAIDSVLKQSHKNLELVVVDDSPKDDENKQNIKDNVENINDSRIRYIQHENNQGACAARNTGIKNTSGDYVAFLDDDDEWLTQKLELQLDKFKNKEIGLVYCDSYTIFTAHNEEVSKKIRSFRFSGKVYNELIKRNFVGSTSFVLIKREALEKCGYFNTTMQSAQDYELWLRISKKYKIDYVSVPLVNYYQHRGERISSNPDKKIQGLEKIIQLNWAFLKDNKKIYSKRKQVIVNHYYARDGYKKAIKKAWEAFKVYPMNIGLLKTMIKLHVKVVRNTI